MTNFLDSDADQAVARKWLDTALSEARTHENRLMGLRAAIALARILRRQGESAKGRDLPTSAYALFPEGVETTDLLEARALLAELEAAA